MKQTHKGTRPKKFRIKRNHKEELRKPNEVIELLRLADKILFVKGDENSEKEFKEILFAYQLNYGYVEVCRLCLLNGKITLLNKKFIHYQNEMICEKCAIKELLIEVRKMGVHGQDRLIKILNKIKDLDKLLGMLTYKKLDSEYTLFDTIKANEIKKTIDLKDIKIHPKLKKILCSKLKKLLPVQMLSVSSGLLDGKNQLIVSATATGKTLIGELAGINNILSKKGRMLYLVPLVALANQKYEQFTKRYSSIAKISIRVGTSRILNSLRDVNTSLSSDIIIATYEGLDFVIRSGNSNRISDIATVVIDEVHNIEDSERGHRLSGLIARLKFINPKAQYIYLSATVGKPQWLAQKLDAQLIEFEERPIPIERHLIFVSEYEKKRLIEKLAKIEYNKVSSKGFKGQTIVFTNSRRKCHLISDGLAIKSMPYHAGLSYDERKRVEHSFSSGKLPVVVTTAALAAGVDFPASQVIFESLAMGIEWLTVREFNQMLGRAGRPDYHDRGIVYILADPEKKFGKSGSEDEVAFKLLSGEYEHFGVDYEEDEQIEELLSNIIVSNRLTDIKKMHISMPGSGSFEYLLKKLIEYKFIRKTQNGYFPTNIGKIVASHFLSVKETFLIQKNIVLEKDPIQIVTELETLDSVYFKYVSQMSENLGHDIPLRVFGAGLDMVFSGEGLSKLNSHLREIMLNFAKEFISCMCKDSPYCGCVEKKFSSKIIELCSQGYSIKEIISEISTRYGVYAYSGDVLNYLDQVVRNLEAIELIAEILNKKEVMEKAKEMIDMMSFRGD